jgi:hypothetical protein
MFAPPAPLFSSLSKEIERHVHEYEAASSPKEKTIALQKMQETSTKLTRLTKPPSQQIQELVYGSNVSTSVRIAVEMNLFEALPENDDSILLSDLSIKVDAEVEFIVRILRVLVAFNVVQRADSESGFTGGYSHTFLSRFLASSSRSTHVKFLFDLHLRAQTVSAGPYFRKYGFNSPDDAKNCPFTFAHGATDANFFDLMEKMPETAVMFNKAMAATAVFQLRDIVRSYMFDQLKHNADGIVLVDVAGGKGHCINEIRDAYPAMNGKFVLEDLKSVLNGGTLVAEDVVLHPYDFFKDVQPIKGVTDQTMALQHTKY